MFSAVLLCRGDEHLPAQDNSFRNNLSIVLAFACAFGMIFSSLNVYSASSPAVLKVLATSPVSSARSTSYMLACFPLIACERLVHESWRMLNKE